jgi:hypothetical protein
MKKILTMTVAAAAMAGVSTLAMAQAGGQGNEHGGAMHQQGGTGAMSPGAGAATHQEGGAQTKPQGGQSAQQLGGKAQERMGQSTESNKGQRAGEQKGAQEEKRGTEQKGAQEEQRGTEQRGAQGENKTGVNANERNASQAPEGRSANVQLSQDQRSRIATIVGKNRTARYNGNVDFTVRVGEAIPRRVHVEVVPEDIVEIVPQYRGFDYVLVGEQILIVDPRTLEIVAIIPA